MWVLVPKAPASQTYPYPCLMAFTAMPRSSDAWLWMTGSALAGAVAGLVSINEPYLLFMIPVALLLLVARRYPTTAPIVALATCATYLGLHLEYRVVVAGVPMSALDLLPILLIVAACSLRAPGQRTLLDALTGCRAIPLFLLGGGLALGTLVGLAHHAAGYQLLRVDRIELSLLVGAIAGLVAGGCQPWQRSVVMAFGVAGVLAAMQQIVSFIYLLTFGHSLWQAFPFGAGASNLEDALASDSVAGIRDNFIPTFVMLPALALAIYRLSKRDVAVATVVVLATVVSLSRSMWIAATVTILTAVVARAASGRLPNPMRVLRFGAVVLAVGTLLGGVGWQVVGARIKESGSRSDASLSGRKVETSAALDALLASPVSAVTGTGAGVVLAGPTARVQYLVRRRQATPILENQFLARWTNFGILSVVGTICLLMWPAVAGSRSLARNGTADPDLIGLGLALPAVLVVGPISGTLLQLHVSLAFWLLAATLLACLRQARVDGAAAHDPELTGAEQSGSSMAASAAAHEASIGKW